MGTRPRSLLRHGSFHALLVLGQALLEAVQELIMEFLAAILQRLTTKVFEPLPHRLAACRVFLRRDFTPVQKLRCAVDVLLRLGQTGAQLGRDRFGAGLFPGPLLVGGVQAGERQTPRPAIGVLQYDLLALNPHQPGSDDMAGTVGPGVRIGRQNGEQGQQED